MTKASRKWLGFTGLGIGLVALGMFVRGRLGIDLDPESIREWVLAAGPIAPVLCVGLVAGRSFVGLPSQVVLIVAGLCFGVFWGTLYGALGLEISGLIAFQLARMAGRDAVHRKIPDRIRPLIKRAGERPGALFITLATGYPIGVLTAYHALAGVTAMKLGVFTLALWAGAIPRAATYAYFGDSLMAGELKLILIATAIIFALLASPLLFPSGRNFLGRVVLGKGEAEEDAVDLNPPAGAEDSEQSPP